MHRIYYVNVFQMANEEWQVDGRGDKCVVLVVLVENIHYFIVVMFWIET